jgi:hypothetical protein
MKEHAASLGYDKPGKLGSRAYGKELTGPEQTDAEQIMLNRLGKDADGRIAVSREPCGEFRRDGKTPAQNCAARIAAHAGIRLVGRWAG